MIDVCSMYLRLYGVSRSDGTGKPADRAPSAKTVILPPQAPRAFQTESAVWTHPIPSPEREKFKPPQHRLTLVFEIDL